MRRSARCFELDDDIVVLVFDRDDFGPSVRLGYGEIDARHEWVSLVSMSAPTARELAQLLAHELGPPEED